MYAYIFFKRESLFELKSARHRVCCTCCCIFSTIVYRQGKGTRRNIQRGNGKLLKPGKAKACRLKVLPVDVRASPHNVHFQIALGATIFSTISLVCICAVPLTISNTRLSKSIDFCCCKFFFRVRKCQRGSRRSGSSSTGIGGCKDIGLTHFVCSVC